MIIQFADLKPLQRYHMMTQTIIPRPIAWVLTENDNGSSNLAPFSYFTALCSDPALVVLSIGKKPDGSLKDTRHNLASGRECVIHIANIEQAPAVTDSSATMEYGQSEVDALGLRLVPFENGLARIEQCPVAYRCKLFDMHEIGPNQQGIIYCELLSVYVCDEAVEAEGSRMTIAPEVINPLARLGGASYAGLSSSFKIERPE